MEFERNYYGYQFSGGDYNIFDIVPKHCKVKNSESSNFKEDLDKVKY
jgi:hypothetical protein